MAVLNPESNDAVDQASDTVQQATQQATQQASNPAQQVSEGLNQSSSILGDANQLLRQVNELMNNPVVKKKLNQKVNQGKQQDRRIMGQQPQPRPQQQPQPPKSGRKQEETTSDPTVNKEDSSKKEIKPKDIDTIEIIQAKLINEEQRKELAEGIKELGMYVKEDLDGMETTLAELRDYVTSEELSKSIEQLKDAGVIQ